MKKRKKEKEKKTVFNLRERISISLKNTKEMSKVSFNDVILINTTSLKVIINKFKLLNSAKPFFWLVEVW